MALQYLLGLYLSRMLHRNLSESNSCCCRGKYEADLQSCLPTLTSSVSDGFGNTSHLPLNDLVHTVFFHGCPSFQRFHFAFEVKIGWNHRKNENPKDIFAHCRGHKCSDYLTFETFETFFSSRARTVAIGCASVLDKFSPIFWLPLN